MTGNSDHGESHDSDRALEELETEERIIRLIIEKTKVKSVVRKFRYRLLGIAYSESDSLNRGELWNVVENMHIAQNEAIVVMERLLSEYRKVTDIESMKKICHEIELPEVDCEAACKLAYEKVATRAKGIEYNVSVYRDLESAKQEIEKLRSEIKQNSEEQFTQQYDERITKEKRSVLEAKTLSGIQKRTGGHGRRLPWQDIEKVEETADVDEGSHQHSKAIGADMWRQLKPVSVPVFTGDKSTYDGWKAAFMSCIDSAPVTAVYKLLQLREALAGEALRSIERLGHSESAYEAAKELLEMKYGGHRRQVGVLFDEMESFPPLQDDCTEEFEKFADLLHITVVKLKEFGRHDELGNGSLYRRIQKKMSYSMLTRYQWWILDWKKEESMESLREWVWTESSFKTIAEETIEGFQYRGFTENVHREGGGHHDQSRCMYTNSGMCKICSEDHDIGDCERLRKMSVSERWDCARREGLCYRCLGENHTGNYCSNTRVCPAQGCRGTHHRLLHRS